MFNLYDLEVIHEAQQKLKAFSITTTKKADHYAKVEELRKFLHNNCESLNPYLFDPDYLFGFEQYKKAVNIFYQDNTKAQLDSKLKYALSQIRRELYECAAIEYQTQEGILVPHPTQQGVWIQAQEK